MVVRIADEQGLTPAAHFAQRIAGERADQEQLLSGAERRIPGRRPVDPVRDPNGVIVQLLDWNVPVSR